MTNPEKTSSAKIEKLYTDVRSIPSYSKKIVQFLRDYPSSGLFKQRRKKFKRRKVKSYYPNEILFLDTIHYRMYKNKNSGFSYILVCVDVFSKKAIGVAQKKIDEFETTLAVERILNQLDTPPKYFVTDLGTEFFNGSMKKLLSRYGIIHYSLRGQNKASIAERFIKTLKSKIERFFFQRKTYRWIDVYQKFIENYNKTYHRSIKMAPDDVNDSNRKEVFENLYPDKIFPSKPRLKIGMRVRLPEIKNIFQKSYKRGWTLQVFKIVAAFSEGSVDYYTVSDLAGNILPRKYYYFELNQISNDN